MVAKRSIFEWMKTDCHLAVLREVGETPQVFQGPKWSTEQPNCWPRLRMSCPLVHWLNCATMSGAASCLFISGFPVIN